MTRRWDLRSASVPLPTVFLPVLGGIMVFYVAAAETAKVIFYRHSAT